MEEDWLADIEAEPEAAAEPLEEGELPDWLQELRTGEPETPTETIVDVATDTVPENTVMEAPAEPAEEEFILCDLRLAGP